MSFTLYLCSGMYRIYQFLAKVKATSTGKLLNSLPRNSAVAELCSGKFIVAYSEWKLPTPPPPYQHLDKYQQ
jgi:hypothetical protein